MATNMEKRVIYDIGHRKLELEEGDDYAALVCTYYPIYPLGNYVKLFIELDGNVLSVYEIRDSWNGTGRFDHDEVELKKEHADVLREKMKSIQSLDDFTELEKTFDEIIQKEKPTFDELIQQLKKETGELIDEIEKEFSIFDKIKEMKVEDIEDILEMLEAIFENKYGFDIDWTIKDLNNKIYLITLTNLFYEIEIPRRRFKILLDPLANVSVALFYAYDVDKYRSDEYLPEISHEKYAFYNLVVIPLLRLPCDIMIVLAIELF
ncbi:MAG: hypothetical protein RMI04_08855 [Thermofilaceae archaeon]|nr:hypothetical protein [Thermofilaceae archaeon]